MPVRDTRELIMMVIDSLTSVQDLQLLLAIMDDPARWWDARAIANETGNATSSTGLGLERLAARNLLDIRVTDDIRFRYQPGTPELERAGRAFAEAYRKDPLEIVKLLTKRRPGSVADFANAFRIRRDDDR